MITDSQLRSVRVVIQHLQQKQAGGGGGGGGGGVAKGTTTVLKGTTGLIKDVYGGAKELVNVMLTTGKTVAPWLLAVPVVVAAGAGFGASKLTGPSEETIDAAQNELLKAEQDRALMEMERMRQAAIADKASKPVRGKARSLRL